MADNKTGEQQSRSQDMADRRAGAQPEDRAREVPIGSQSATEDAGETMRQGIEETTGGSQGPANTGREPEYYGEKHTP